MTERRIVKVIHTDKEARVFLDDGSELKGLIDARSSSGVNSPTTVTISAYVYPHKPRLFHYINTRTGERVSLTPKEADRFFDNRDSWEWEVNYEH